MRGNRQEKKMRVVVKQRTGVNNGRYEAWTPGPISDEQLQMTGNEP